MFCINDVSNDYVVTAIISIILISQIVCKSTRSLLSDNAYDELDCSLCYAFLIILRLSLNVNCIFDL